MTPAEKEPLKFLAKHLFFGIVAAITFGVLVLVFSGPGLYAAESRRRVTTRTAAPRRRGWRR